MIITTQVAADKNPLCSVDQGGATQYALNNGRTVGEWYWWLRTAGESSSLKSTYDAIACVRDDGEIIELGGLPYHSRDTAVRPAMWIDLN